MKYVIIAFSFFCFFTCCKKSSDNIDDGPVRFTKEHFRIPLPEGIYKPQGLRPLDMREMVIARERQDFSFDMPLKDFLGKDIVKDSVFSSPKPYFIQLYVNDSGRVVEGVVFPITRDFQNAILEWK